MTDNYQYNEPFANESRREEAPPDSPNPYDSYNLEEQEDAAAQSQQTQEPQQSRQAQRHPLLALLQLIATPVNGWKQLRNARFTPTQMGIKCFWPVLFCAALSALMTPLYFAAESWSDAIMNLVGIAMTFMLSNYAIMVAATIILPRAAAVKMKQPFGHVFIMAALCTLMLTVMLWNLLPTLTPVTVFLPLYTIYLVVRGAKFLRVPEDMVSTVAIRLCVLIIGMPMLLYWLFLEI